LGRSFIEMTTANILCGCVCVCVGVVAEISQ